MATANRKELHKHFIRGRDPMAPIGDGAPNLRQQVKAGQKGSWEEEGREVEIILWDCEEDGSVERGSISLLSLLFIQPVWSLQHTFNYLVYEDFSDLGF